MHSHSHLALCRFYLLEIERKKNETNVCNSIGSTIKTINICPIQWLMMHISSAIMCFVFVNGPNSFSHFLWSHVQCLDLIVILMYSCLNFFSYFCPPKENKNDIWDFFSMSLPDILCIPTVVKQILSWYETVTTHIFSLLFSIRWWYFYI